MSDNISSQVSDDRSSQSSVSIKQDGSLLGVFYGIGMNVNDVIGSGIVTTPGIILNSVKSPGIVMLLWLLCGIVSMSGSLSYVELGVIHRISGGETQYLQTAYPYPKYIVSYLFSFMFIFAIRPGLLCAILQSGAQYFWFTIKGRQFNQEMEQHIIGWKLHFSPFWFIKFLAVIFLLIITGYHMLSNRLAKLINQTLVIIKLITYSIIAIAGFVQLCMNPDSRNNWQSPLDSNPDITAYSSSILLVMFSYNGWNNLNYSLDEFKNPEKKLIFSNSISVAIVTAMYLLVNVAFISVVPKGELTDPDKINETIAASFFGKLFGGNPIVVRIFTALIVLSVMGTAATNVWSGSRVIVAAAKSDFFPKYSQGLKTWHERLDTPVNALFAQLIWCSLIIFFVGGSFTISSFSLFSTFAMYSYWIFYFATGIGLLVIRRRNKYKSANEKRDTERNNILSKKGKKLFSVPLPVATIFILTGLFILIFSFIVDDTCPITIPDCNRKDLMFERMSPVFISYGFLFIGIMFWYFFYRPKHETSTTKTNQDEQSI